MKEEDLLSLYIDKVLEVNRYLNLTGIKDKTQAEILHLEDSLTALTELNKAPKGIYVDLGSGGGFPGVPLALYSGRETILVDSIEKKMVAVEKILKDLGINQHITTYSDRIENFTSEYKDSIAVITARALAKISVLMELASPLLQQDGILICFKASINSEEYNHACLLQKKLGMKILKKESFTLNDSEIERTLVVIKKIDRPLIKLPRAVGYAQKKPL